MTDRELLEAAARAAGIEADWNDPECADYEAQHEGMWLCGERSPSNSQFWNPLKDDGDALRLAVKLRLDVNIEDEAQVAWWQGEDLESVCVPFEDDECAAARRAIVRAAAWIGRTMP